MQLLLLRKSDDEWWFTLLHEIGHVLIHGESRLYLNGEDTAYEEESDQFAAEILIPAEYVDWLPRSWNISAIESLAAELGIAPSIVLGRAQRVTRDFAWGQRLKRSVDWVPAQED